MRKLIEKVVGYATAVALTCGTILVSATAPVDGTSLAIDCDSTVSPAPKWYDCYKSGTSLKSGTEIQVLDGCYAYALVLFEDYPPPDPNDYQPYIYEYLITDVKLQDSFDDFVQNHNELLMRVNDYEDCEELSIKKTGNNSLVVMSDDGYDGIMNIKWNDGNIYFDVREYDDEDNIEDEDDDEDDELHYGLYQVHESSLKLQLDKDNKWWQGDDEDIVYDSAWSYFSMCMFECLIPHYDGENLDYLANMSSITLDDGSPIKLSSPTVKNFYSTLTLFFWIVIVYSILYYI
jgi:hypothetical protein